MTKRMYEPINLDMIEWPEEEMEVFWNDGKRNSKSHRKTASTTMGRQFIAWDGEGITYPEQIQQSYVLFAASTGDQIIAPEGKCLSTQECFDLLFRVKQQVPDAYHIGFGFGYDVNQILNSFTRRELYGLAKQTRIGRSYNWNGYLIKIHPGKMFRVSKGAKGERTTITIYDTFGFFQCGFLKVVRSYFPEELSRIENGKGNRGTFRYSEIHEIAEYCNSENELLVRIIDRLRENFEDRGLYLREWHGPGAVATASLKKYNVKSAMGTVPKEVSRCSAIAYQAGWFENIRAGYHKQKVWEYDLNSAYPDAISRLPDLSSGTWELVREFEPGSFGMWHVKYRDNRNERSSPHCLFRFHPLFYRDDGGRVYHPGKTEGWYWTPEVENLTTILDPNIYIDIMEGWVYRPSNDNLPFRHIREELYPARLEHKKLGLGGLERVDKLEMNSYYGKFAQRSGWFIPGDKIPSYHQLEWAGYITSSTRARLWRAAQLEPDSVFAFETDAIFSTKPLDLPIGNQLGQWSETVFDDILYIQSGFYFAHNSDGITEHYRGFDKGSITFEMCMDWLDKLDPFRFLPKETPESQKLYGPTHRFVGFKRALQSRKKNYWRSWETTTREITIGQEGKRVHMPTLCPCCMVLKKDLPGSGSSSDGCSHGFSPIKWTKEMHGLVNFRPGGWNGDARGASKPHRIPWEDTEWHENIWGAEKQLEMADGSIL